jgi:oligosaccharide reducing-end xylanase
MARKLFPYITIMLVAAFLLAACGAAASPSAPSASPVPPTNSPLPATLAPTPSLLPTSTVAPTPLPALPNISYRNLFKEYLGASDATVQGKIQAAWQQIFYGSDATQRVYYPVGADMAYIIDINDNDVRTEGMSYGMMIAVQLDKKAEFDRIWKWAKTYMYQTSGPYQGYFAWHCSTDGKQLDAMPASDGEEWFVTALFMAAGRWGNGEGIFNYQQEAQALLSAMHKRLSDSGLSSNMFNRQENEVVFVPSGFGATYTDPSYHLPAFYELWGRWADQDNQFWFDAASTSRAFFKKAANPQTGLMPDYAHFDGTPYRGDIHENFASDAWRTLSYVAVDHAWFGADDPWQVDQSNRVLTFLASQGLNSYPSFYSLDGKKALATYHSLGLVANAAVAAEAASPEIGKPFVQALWNAPMSVGQYRYYDDLLYMLAMLNVSGNFRVYAPPASAKP